MTKLLARQSSCCARRRPPWRGCAGRHGRRHKPGPARGNSRTPREPLTKRPTAQPTGSGRTRPPPSPAAEPHRGAQRSCPPVPRLRGVLGSPSEPRETPVAVRTSSDVPLGRGVRRCALGIAFALNTGRPRRDPPRNSGRIAAKGYDHLRRRHHPHQHQHGPKVRSARRGTEDETSLGRHRWLVERTVSWLLRCALLGLRSTAHSHCAPAAHLGLCTDCLASTRAARVVRPGLSTSPRAVARASCHGPRPTV